MVRRTIIGFFEAVYNRAQKLLLNRAYMLGFLLHTHIVKITCLVFNRSMQHYPCLRFEEIASGGNIVVTLL